MGRRGYCGINPNRPGFVIGLNANAMDRRTIRHELYHLKKDRNELRTLTGNRYEDILLMEEKDKTDSPWTNSYYINKMEPRANLYSLTGIEM